MYVKIKNVPEQRSAYSVHFASLLGSELFEKNPFTSENKSEVTKDGGVRGGRPVSNWSTQCSLDSLD